MDLSVEMEQVVNVFYTFAKAVERGDFFGVAAAYDAPTAAWTSRQQPLYLPKSDPIHPSLYIYDAMRRVSLARR